MIAFIDDHREAYGVRADLQATPIAPSTYYEHGVRRRDPTKLAADEGNGLARGGPGKPVRTTAFATLIDAQRRAIDAAEVEKRLNGLEAKLHKVR